MPNKKSKFENTTNFGSPYGPSKRYADGGPATMRNAKIFFGDRGQETPHTAVDPIVSKMSESYDVPKSARTTISPEDLAAARSSNFTATMAGVSTDFLKQAEAQMMKEVFRAMHSGHYGGARTGRFSFSDMPEWPTSDGIPASLRAARSAVEKYISEAPDQSFDDIAGNGEALGQLREAIEAPVIHKELYAAYGMTMPKGALLSGPPGCGKTMFARAAASEMKRLYGDKTEFISISGSEIQSKYVGETEKTIKAMFTYAREYMAYHGHPLLIFMDEAEVLLPDRSGNNRHVAPWEESQVATFLAEMDGMRESGAFVLLATNRPEVIDQAVLRDGRCDFKIVVKAPEAEAIKIILNRNFEGVLIGDKTDMDGLIMAAVNALYDPEKIIHTAQAIGFSAERGIEALRDKNFLLRHVVSGAMAASIPSRAKRFAFARDKESGTAHGVGVADVTAAVEALFVENKGLDHSFALRAFTERFREELEAEQARKAQTLQ